MTPERYKRAAFWFALTGLVFLVAAAIPVLKGEPSKNVFLVLGITWILLSLAAAAKGRAGAKTPKP